MAWRPGARDLDALAAMLDPAVTLRATQPGPWDCQSRGQVMTLLWQREAEWHGQPPNDADVNARGLGNHAETPLHLAASSDDEAAIDALLDAAALGLLERVRAHLEEGTQTTMSELLWAACHGSQAQTAAYLLDQGADINWGGYDELTPLAAAQRFGAPALVEWLHSHGAASQS